MAEQTKIEWCDHTWNPWEGCTAVSPACDHCYAENIAKRFGKDIWGAHASRRKTKTKPNVYKWNRKLESNGKREKVFVASMADVFDNHKSILPEWRNEIWQTIKDCDNLDFLLLTKRPQNIKRYLPEDWGVGYENVWLGATVENQTEADRRIPELLRVPARCHFLSCEPLLEFIDITKWLYGPVDACNQCPLDADCDCHPKKHHTIDWVIAGGESGHGARPTHPRMFKEIRDQCRVSSIPFLFKQWGEWVPGENVEQTHGVVKTATYFGDNWEIDEEDLSSGPEVNWNDPVDLYKIGKKKAGRILDGVVHDEFPDI